MTPDDLITADEFLVLEDFLGDPAGISWVIQLLEFFARLLEHDPPPTREEIEASIAMLSWWLLSLDAQGSDG